MHLNLGPGPGARLLAPGLPDTIRAHAGRLGWLGRAALFITDGAQVTAHGPLHAEHLGAGPAWTAWAGDGARLVVDKDEARIDQLDAPLIQVAGPLAVVREATGRRVRGPGMAPLPLGARTGRVVAWTDGQGVAWRDRETLYRRARSGPVRVAGTLPGAVRHLLAGPGGALLADCDQGSFVVPPARTPVPLPHRVSVEGARFSADASQLMARGVDGVHLISVRTARIERTWTGPLVPVGFAPQPVLLDEDRGTLQGFQLPPLLPTSTAAAPGWVFGPGGGAWELARGVMAWRHPVLLEAWALAPVGRQLACLVGRKIIVLDAQTGAQRASWFVPRTLAPTAEEVLDLRAGHERLVVRGAHGTAAFDPEGQALGPAELPEEPLPPSDHPLVRLLDADGAQQAGGRLFAWTDDGTLACAPL